MRLTRSFGNKKIMAESNKTSLIVKVCIIVPLAVILFLPTVMHAETILPTPNGDKTNCPGNTNCGNYEVNDFVRLASNIARFIWGISGALALLFLVYGGILFIVSMGSSDKVGRARQIIFNSIAGLVIVFCSWMIVSFIFQRLGVQNANQWNTGNWFQGS